MAKRKNKIDMHDIDTLRYALSIGSTPTQPDQNTVKRQMLFDFLRKLGLKSAPSWFYGFESIEKSLQAVMAGFGQPDHVLIDQNSLEAYKKLFEK